MDVFGTVLGAIDLVGKLIGYLQAVKGAREDRQKLLSEVSALGALLEVLRGRLSHEASVNDDGDSISDLLVKAGINRPLQMCCDALNPIVDMLRRILSDTNTGTSTLAGKMRDLRWPFLREEIKMVLGNIERLKSLVSLALQTSLMEFIEKARDELAAVGLTIEEIKSVVSSLEAGQRAHTKRIELVQDDLTSLGAVLQGTANGIAEIRNTIDRNQEGNERQSVLRWLSAPDFDQKHTTVFDKHALGTGEWFLRHPKFVAWRQGEYSVLWCPGNPGVGKSVMASAVIDHLQKGSTEDTATVYIYFEYTSENYTARQLVEALLSQLVRRGMSGSGMKSLQKHLTGNHPTLEELWSILEAEFGTYTQVFIVIDALDEADSSTWIPLLERLRKLSRINILATSRDIGSVAVEFQGDCRLDVMTDTGDLRRYIEGRISNSTGGFKRVLNASPSLRAEVVIEVTEKAGGMFLLARLHMNSLETESRVIDIRQALIKLPQDLKSAYDATVARISDKNKLLALRIFSWVIHAARPMMIDELQYALAIEDGMTTFDPDYLHDRATLTSVCLGLVILHYRMSDCPGSNQYFGLVHYTTQDYLRDYLSTHFPYPAHLAVTCLRSLSLVEFNGLPLDADSKWELMCTPLADYAINFWGDHARMHCDDPTVRRLSMELLRDHQRVAKFGSITCGTENPSALQLCVRFRLKDYLIYLLDNGFDINSKSSDGATAVTEAAIHGWDDILQLLLARKGVDTNPKGINGHTPLTSAAMRGHQKIVELLLAKEDVDVNWRDDAGKTAIAHAAETGNTEIVKLLLERDGVNINSRDKNGFTPLAFAILGEHEAMVQLLLARDDLNISIKNNMGDTHLAIAAYRNNYRITRMLLAKSNVDANSRALRGLVALSIAASLGHDAVVKVLLAQDGINTNAMDLDRNTPLDLPVLEGK